MLGRLDDQVKIRGFRVEPGEVEALLARHPAVREVAVVARELGRESRLVAYVVTDAASAAAALQGWLRAQVPEYLVPAAVVRLERLPLTANGKVDRAALPAPPRGRPAGNEPATPRTSVETTLAGIWAEVLALDAVGIHDNFFEWGGDSILSIQVIARANRAGLRFTPKQLFRHQTIAELAPLAGGVTVVEAEQAAIVGAVPLTPIQHWFFEQDLADAHHFNQAIAFEIPFETGTQALESAVAHLLLHHDALRLRFERTPDGWRQWTTSSDDCSVVSQHALQGLDPDEQSRVVERTAIELQGGLDLGRGPIVRVARFDWGPSRASQVLVVVHHLAVDLVSWRVLVEDLREAIQQASLGIPIELPRKTTSFKDWAERLLALASSSAVRDELSWWCTDDRADATRLPADLPYDEAANTIANAKHVTVSLGIDETRSLLQEAPRSYRAQVPDLLLAALLLALEEWTGQLTFVIDIEGHGRDVLGDEVDVSRTVGWFTTIAPVLFRLETRDVGSAVAAVRKRMQELPRHGAGYGLLRYLATDTILRERLASVGYAQIAFNYLGRFAPADGDDRLARWSEADPTGPTRSARGRRRHLLEIDGGVVRGRLVMHWTYCEAVHRHGTIERVARGFVGALRRVLEHGRSRVGPSDLPPARLDTHDLDRVRHQWPLAEDVYPLSPLQEGAVPQPLCAARRTVRHSDVGAHARHA